MPSSPARLLTSTAAGSPDASLNPPRDAEAKLPGPRGGLGAVGGAELAQQVGHVLFDRVQRHEKFAGNALV